ncbi:GNAT family N-acetyltransferase [Actinomyces sp.]|uniref:GNAT family N-acetyltransferase n=1 Tax=Actinomyces sp. TaxID=29317 RepID=UPI00290B9419|nr:GNAT family N-acetyltransferase [Actinomyces sp.]MDU6756140.1 GNAT family N-acetyltransferase [Actinomyces sp.]
MKMPVRLRRLRVEDATQMAIVLSDRSLYTFTGGEPPSANELARRYAIQSRGGSSDGTEEWINLIVTLGLSEQPIGYVQATVPRCGDATEIAWVIGKHWQGHGYAKEAAKLLSSHLATRGITHLIAHIHPEHIASQHVAAYLEMMPTARVVGGEVRWERR